MKEQFVTYEIAERLKELGFDKSCLGWYRKYSETIVILEYNSLLTRAEYADLFDYKRCLKAPLWQQVIDWFREKYDLIIEVTQEEEGDGVWYWEYGLYFDCNLDKPIGYGQNEYMWDKYEDAREHAVLKAINEMKHYPNC